MNSECLVQLLSPYGNWEHKNGMQKVDKEAALKMRNSFMRGVDRIFGVPIYMGHPDEGKNAHTAKPVGRVESVSVTREGVAISARYSEEAYKKLTKGKVKWLSPRWRMEKLADGSFRPVKLISVGMTNNPNIPGSGTLLESPTSVKKQIGKQLSSANENCATLKKNLEKTARAAAELKNQSARLKREGIDKNIAKHSEKPAPHELAKMALEQADKTGASYLESFAALRRKYYGKTKFGAHERNIKQRNT